MEQLFTPRKSVWRQKVPQAISNSALVAMVTLCYFGLVSPTLELVQTAQLVQANTMMRTQFDIPLSINKTQIDAMRNHANSKVDATIIATFPVETPKAIVPVVLLQSNNQGDQNKLSYATLQPNSQNLPASGPFADPVTAGRDTVVLPELYDVISTKPAADNSANPGNPLSSESANSMEPVLDPVVELKVTQLESELQLVEQRLIGIETAVDFYRVAVDTPQFVNRTQDELKRAFNDLLKLYDEKSVLEKKSEVIGDEIEKLTSGSDSIYTPEVTHSTVLPLNSSNKPVVTPPVVPPFNSSSKPSVKPPVVLPPFSSSSMSNGGGENCGNGVDDDGDRSSDCADMDCQDSDMCKSSAGDENCTNGKDDDGDNDADCNDMDCATYPTCSAGTISSKGLSIIRQ